MESLQVYTSYGRNFIRPYSYQPLLTLYNANRSTFQKAGVTLQDMFDGYDMEISNNFELGARFKQDRFEIMPTLFYSTNSDLLTTVYDPRVKLSYQQNIGDATGYGLEVETNAFITDHITLFVNPTYCILTYDDDLTYQGATLDTDGKQVVDTPEWMVKAGVIFRYGGFEVVPMVRYIGKRYGDAAHTESVGDYFLADLKIDYTTPKIPHMEALKLSVELQNIFGEEYISLINASDDSRAGSTSYYAGAPFTALIKASMAF
jgi:iron complex outermembrane receptor protein